MSLDGSNHQLAVVSQSAVSRRRFLIVSVSGVAAAAFTSLLSACGGGQTAAPAAATPAAGQPAAAQAGPGGFSGGGSLKILMRSHFVPAFDTWFDKWADDWAEKNKVNLEHDHISSNEIPAKVAAEVAASSGHDLYFFTRPADVPLYARQLVDVTEDRKSVV